MAMGMRANLTDTARSPNTARAEAVTAGSVTTGRGEAGVVAAADEVIAVVVAGTVVPKPAAALRMAPGSVRGRTTRLTIRGAGR